MVIYDEQGHVLAAATGMMLNGLDVRTIESIGMRMGLNLIKDLCFQQIKAKCNCQELMQALQK